MLEVRNMILSKSSILEKAIEELYPSIQLKYHPNNI